MSDIDVHGTVADGFQAVREEFAAAVGTEAGAQLAVYVRGRRVVDLWAGDEVTGDTLTGVYSATKGAATLVVALLVQDSALDLDQPVACWWPEFAVAGKDRITLRDVLSHRSGVIGVDGGLNADELADDQVIARRLAGQRPYWRPGSAYGYGGFVTFAIVGEVVRRATGRSLQDHFEERVRAHLTGWTCTSGCRRRWRTGTGRCCRDWRARTSSPRSGRTSPARTASPGSGTA